MPPPPSESRSDFDRSLAWISGFTDWEQLLDKAPGRTNFDLGRLHRFLERLQNPHRGRPIVHITGTKGKTSTTFMVDAILRAQGMSTLRFISPHVETVHERLAVSGVSVDDATFVSLVEQLRPEVERLKVEAPEDLPSFFECITLMGFLLARDRNVDAIVLEVGLGGRLDATNVVDPTVSCITSIALDHTRILGDTVQAIAFEKGGIIKPGRPVILGLDKEDPAFEVLAQRAKELDATLSYPGKGFKLLEVTPTHQDEGAPGLAVRYQRGQPLDCSANETQHLKLSLGSIPQATNAMVALSAADLVCGARGQSLDIDAAHTALASLNVPGRDEWYAHTPPVLLDGAHTEESLRAFAQTAAHCAKGRTLHAILGLTKDRDPATLFAPFIPLCSSITLCPLTSPRSGDPMAMAAALREAYPEAFAHKSLQTADSALEALELARTAASSSNEDSLMIVGGSIYLVGAVRPLLKRGS